MKKLILMTMFIAMIGLIFAQVQQGSTRPVIDSRTAAAIQRQSEKVEGSDTFNRTSNSNRSLLETIALPYAPQFGNEWCWGNEALEHIGWTGDFHEAESYLRTWFDEDENCSLVVGLSPYTEDIIPQYAITPNLGPVSSGGLRIEFDFDSETYGMGGQYLFHPGDKVVISISTTNTMGSSFTPVYEINSSNQTSIEGWKRRIIETTVPTGSFVYVRFDYYWGQEPYTDFWVAMNNFSVVDEAGAGPPAEVFIGNPASTVQNLTPIIVDAYSGISQTIYYESEIGVYGTIEQLTFRYRPNAQSLGSRHVKIYLATAPRSEFYSQTDWLPFSNFTMVHDASVVLPSSSQGESNVTFTLSTPYQYNGGNLVIMCVTNHNALVEGVGWISTQVPNNRTLFANFSALQNPPIDPAIAYPTPASPGVQWCNMDTWRGNLRIHFSSTFVAEHNLIANSLVSPAWTNVGVPTEFKVNVTNAGTQMVNGADYNIRLMSGASLLTSAPGVNLASNASYEFTIPYTFISANRYQITGYIDYPSDQAPDNNTTSPQFINVHNLGILESYVGTPGSPVMTEFAPFNFFNLNSLSQTIYRENEIGAIGTINSIRYEFNGGSIVDDPSKPIKIWMATTTMSSYGNNTSWIPFHNFTLVYDGPLNLDLYGWDEINITLNTPYEYNSGNLVIMTNRVFDPINATYASNQNRWRQTTIVGNRTIHAQQNGAIGNQYDPAIGYPTGTLSSNIPNINFTMEAEFTAGYIAIGEGTNDPIRSPIFVGHDYSYSQTIYLQEEINISGNQIYKIGFHWDGGESVPRDKILEIYMGHTDADHILDPEWPTVINTLLPTSIFSKVYDGVIHLPDTADWVEVELDVPFIYNNVDNLAIGIIQKAPGHIPFMDFGQFYSTPTTNGLVRTEVRYRITNPVYFENLEEQWHPWQWHDPIMRYHAIPNVRLYNEMASTEPVFSITPAAGSFGKVPVGESSNLRQFTIRNIGMGTLTVSSVSLGGIDASHFDLFPVAGLPASLGYLETVTVHIAFSPATFGIKEADLIVSHSSPHGPASIPLVGEGVQSTVITIGTGTIENNNLPVFPNWEQSYSQFIYYGSEIPVEEGEINSLSFFYNGNPMWSVMNNWDVYLGLTDRTDFPTSSGASWIAQSELTPVFSGTIPISSSSGWVEIVLDIPFMYNNSQNLVVAVNRIGSGGWNNGPAFLASASTPANRGMYVARDGVPFDPNNLTNGDTGVMRSSNMPNVRIQISSAPPEPDAIYIGDVNSTSGTYEYPFNFYYRSSVSQVIYLSDEINSEAGMISKLDYYFSNANVPFDTQDKEVVIWMANVGENFASFPTTTSWVPANQFQKVYDGLHPNIPVGSDFAQTTFNLHSPFVYTGGNLVIMTMRKFDTVGYFSGSCVYLQTPAGSIRTLYRRSDSVGTVDPENPITGATGSTSTNISNITLYIMPGGLGELSGVVTSGGNPVSDVQISLSGTAQSGLTDASGHYSIPYLAPLEYDLFASKMGFYDSEVLGVSVIADEITTQNITMTAIPTVTISGRVLGSDTGLPVARASVSLSGYGEYPVVWIDSSGNFSIPDVYASNTYSLVINAVGYLPYVDNELELGVTDLNLGDIIVTENAFPPSNVMASVLSPSVVQVSWNAPNIPDPNNTWFSHVTATSASSGLGTTSSHTLEMGHRYSQSQLQSLGIRGLTLSQISFVTSTFSGSDPATVLNSVEVRAYVGGSSTPFNPGTLVYSQNVPVNSINFAHLSQSTALVWNDIILHSPVSIPIEGEFWITVLFDAQVGYAAPVTPQGSWTDNFGNLYSFNGGAWQTSTGVGTPAWQRDFLIRGQASTASGRTISMGRISYDIEEIDSVVAYSSPLYSDRGESRISSEIPTAKDAPEFMNSWDIDNNSRVFESYNVYRTLDANLSDESLWTTMATNFIGRTYFDSTWGSVADGSIYRYIVKSVYTNDNQSVGVPSNAVVKSPAGQVIIGNPASTITSTESPFQYYYQTGLSQTIYLPGEINGSGYINSITYDFNGNGGVPDDIIHRVWMAYVDKSVFTGTNDWVPFSEFTLVFEGTLAVNLTGWHQITIDLSSPYYYDGEYSLVIMTQRNNPPANWWSGNAWRQTPGNGNRTLWIRRDGANHDPAAPGAGSLNGNIPNVTLQMTLEEPSYVVTLGTGTTTATPPVEQYYDHSYSQTIYLSEEINMLDSNITRISYHWSGSNVGLNWKNWEVYMGHTDRVNFPNTNSTSWISQESMSLVYAGTVIEPIGAGWIEVVLDTPFTYDSSQNLVIAVHKQGSWSGTGSAGMFFNTGTPGQNRSMMIRADGTSFTSNIQNNSFGTAWTVFASYPNIRIQFGASSETPVFTITPEEHDFGTVAIHDFGYQDFNVINWGGSVLVISEIEIIGDDVAEFTLVNELTFPLLVSYGEGIEISVRFAPETEGTKTAQLVLYEVGTGRAINMIPLFGESVDATISEFPHLQNFDEKDILPIGWGSIVQATQPATVDIFSSSSHSAPNALRMLSDATDTAAVVLAYTPLIENLDNAFVSLWARTDSLLEDVVLLVGTLSDVEDQSSFVEIEAITLSSTYQHYFVNMEGAVASRIAFKQGLGGTVSRTIFIDDVEIEIKSSTPTLWASHEHFDYGNVSMNTVSYPKTFTIRNVGADGLYVSEVMVIDPYGDYVIYDELATELSFDFLESYEFTLSFNPKQAGELSATVVYLGADDIVLGRTTLTINSIDTSLLVTPSFRNFGDVSIGSFGPTQSFNITNQGLEELVIDNIELIGDDADEFLLEVPYSLLLPYPLDPQESMNFSVQFAPNSVGLKEARALISYDGIKSFEVILSGNCPSFEVIQIGTGTSTSNTVPVVSNWSHSYSQQIYYQSQINKSGNEITKISFFYNGNVNWPMINNWAIYLGHTSRTDFPATAATNWIPASSLTKVFEGIIGISSVSGWVEIELDTPFFYNNVDNLVVAVNRLGTNDVYNSGPAFNVTTSTPANRAMYVNRDTPGPYDVNDLPGASGRSSALPNIRLTFEPMPFEILPPVNLLATSGNWYNDLSWQSPDTEMDVQYNVYRSGALIGNRVDSTYFRDTTTYNGIEYTYYVTAVYLDIYESQSSNIVSVMSLGETLVPPQNFVADLVETTVTLSWESPELTWFTHTQGDLYGGSVGLGETAAATLLAAQRFTPEMLNGLGVAGKALTKISIVTNQSTANYTLMVWAGGSPSEGNFLAGDLLYQQAIGTGLTPEVWLEYDLDEPVLIPEDMELWIGYQAITSGGYPLGRDVGPAIEGFGALIQWGTNPWRTLSAAGIPGVNWMIKGFAETPSGSIVLSPANPRNTNNEPPMRIEPSRGNAPLQSYALDNPIDISSSSRASRDFQGFNVYKNNVLLTPTPIAGNSYVDANLAIDAYMYEVTSLYTTGESVPASAVVRIGLNAPTNLSAIAGSGSAELTWEAPEYESVTLLGYRAYANGNAVSDIIIGTSYTLGGLYNGVTYSLSVTAVYDTTYPLAESDPSNAVLATPTGEILYQPLNLSLTANYSEVSMSWEAAGVQEGWFTHAIGNTMFQSIGTNGAVTFTVAQRFTPEMLMEMGVGGSHLTRIGYMGNVANATYTLRVWTGGTASPLNPGTLVHSQLVSGNTTVGVWRDIILDTPIDISVAHELWIGYMVTTTTGYPAAADVGPALDGFGNLMQFNNIWTTASALVDGFDYNFLIRGYAETASGAVQILPINKHQYTYENDDILPSRNNTLVSSGTIDRNVNDANHRGDSREVVSYNIYVNGNMVGSTTGLSYIAEATAAGNNTFGVTGVFSDGGESRPTVRTYNVTAFDRIIDSYPYAEDFETTVQSGWRNRDVDGDGSRWTRIENSQQANSGVGFMRSTSNAGMTTDNWLISPKFVVPSGDNQFLRYFVSSGGVMNYAVMVSTTGTSIENFDILYSGDVDTAAWTDMQLSLSEYKGMEIYLAFRHYNSASGTLMLDDVTIGSPEFIIDPVEKNFGLVSINSNTSQVFTISNSTAIAFELTEIELFGSEYFNMLPVVLPVIVTVDNPFSFTVIYAPTVNGFHNAEIHILDDTVDTARIINLVGQSLDSVISNLPYVQDFSLSEPHFWTRLAGMPNSSLTPFTGNWTTAPHWVLGSFANNATHPNGQSARVNLFGQTNAWLVSPPIILNEAHLHETEFFYVGFDMAFTGRIGAPQLNGIDDKFIVFVSENDGADWTSLVEWNNTGGQNILNNISRTGERINFSLSGFDGAIKIALYAESTIMNADNLIHIDNFSIGISAINPVRDLRVTFVDEDIVDLAWLAPEAQAVGTISRYDIYRNDESEAIGTSQSLTYRDANAPSDAFNMYSVVTVYTNPILYSDAVYLANEVFVPLFVAPIVEEPELDRDEDGVFTAVVLAWEVPEELEYTELLGYRVYRDDVLLNVDEYIPVDDPNFSDTNITSDIKYVYGIAAVYEYDAEDFRSLVIKESKRTEVEIIVPQYNAPYGLTARIGDALIELSWSSPQAQNYGSILKYEVYRDGSLVYETPDQTVFMDSEGILNDVTYEYHVVAIWGGEIPEEGSAPSASKLITPFANAVPQNLELSVVNEVNVYLSWTAASSSPARAGARRNTGHTLIGYSIYRDSELITASLLPPTQGNYTDMDRAKDELYEYRVIAVYADEVISFPATDSIIVPLYTPVTSLISELLGDTIKLSWILPVEQQYGVVWSIEVIRDEVSIIMLGATSTEYMDTDILLDTRYDYDIVVHYGGDITGSSSAVSTSMIVPIYNAPLALTAANGLDSMVELLWTAPIAQNLGSVVGYIVYRDGAPATGSLPPTQTSYTDTNLANAVDYEYWVVAEYSFEGFGSFDGVSQPSNTAIGRPEDNILMPGSITALQVGHDIVLSWTAPVEENTRSVNRVGGGARDDSRAFLGYHVYRNGERLTTEGPVHVMSFTDNNTAIGTTYTYGVTAMYDSGESNPRQIIVRVYAFNPVTNLVATFNHTSGFIGLSWTRPVLESNETIGSFVIMRNDLSAPIATVGPTATSYIDQTIELDSEYVYSVMVIYVGAADGQSLLAFSNPVVAPKYTPVANLELLLVENNGVQITWDAPALQTYGSVIAYRITRNGILISGTLGELEFIDSNLIRDTKYTYGVIALYEFVGYPSYAGGSIAIEDEIIVPQFNAPRNLHAVSGLDSEVRLSWDAPVNQTYGTVSGYRVYRDGYAISGDIPFTQRLYTDSPLENAVNYEYHVIAIWGGVISGESLESNKVIGRPEDNILMPGSIFAEVTDAHHVILTWGAVGSSRDELVSRGSTVEGGPRGMLGYRVYRNNVALFTTPINALTFTDTNTTIDTRYIYGVTAVYDSGESMPREIAVIVPIFNPVLNVVANIDNDGHGVITWAAPMPQQWGEIVLYEVRRSGSNDIIGYTTTTTYTDLSLVNVPKDAQYSYFVNVLYANPTGRSIQSQSNNIIVPLFNPPRNLNATINATDEVVLTWMAPVSATYGTVTGYRITRGGNVIGTLQTNTLTFTDGNVSVDNQYQYGVAALYNSPAGQPWGMSIEEQHTIIVPVYRPVSNVIAAYNANTGFVDLSWALPPVQNFGTVSEIIVRRAGSSTAIGILAPGISTFTDITVEMDKSYFYSVQMVYTGAITGSSIEVTSNSIVVPKFTPVTNVAAVLNNDKNVVLTWTPPAPQEFGTVTEYRIIRNGSAIGTALQVSQSYTDENVAVDTMYEYGVIAIYTNPSGASVAVNAPPILNPIFNPVTELRETSADGVVHLSWKAPAAQNNGTLAGYKIFRHGVALFDLPHNVLTFSDTTVSNGVSYTYYLVASYVNPVGESVPSNEVVGKPMEDLLPPTDPHFEIVSGNNVVLRWTAPEGNFIGFKVSRNGELPTELFEEPMYIDANVPIGAHTYYIVAVYNSGTSIPVSVTVDVVSEGEGTGLPLATELFANYPNPFNPNTTIEYNVSQAAHVNIEIYNVRGQKVRTLINAHNEIGNYKVVWNGKDDNGRDVSSGMYLYIMKADDFYQVKRMTLMK